MTMYVKHVRVYNIQTLYFILAENAESFLIFLICIVIKLKYVLFLNKLIIDFFLFR